MLRPTITRNLLLDMLSPRDPGIAPKGFDAGVLQTNVCATAQIGGQFDWTVPYTAQSAHLEALVLAQPAHFAVAPFVQTDAIPAVTAVRGLGLDAIEVCRPVLELYAAAQPLQ